MKRKFSQSYRLGISAGILTGFLLGLLSLPFLPFFEQMFGSPFNLLGSLFSSTSSFILFGIIFVAVVNKLPSSSIYIKSIVLSIILTIIGLPFFLLVKEISILFVILGNIVGALIHPLIYGFFYILLAKHFRGVTRINKVAFVFVTLFLLMALFVGMIISVGIDFLQAQTPLEINAETAEREIFEQVNIVRTTFDREPLQWHEALFSTAKSHSNNLVITGNFAHNLPEKTFNNRFRKRGFFYLTGGENIFGGPPRKDFAEWIVESWMESPLHRSLIVDRDGFFSHGGVGVSCNKFICIATLDVADFDYSNNFRLAPDEYYYLNLNDASLGLGKSYPVSIKVTATAPVNIYLTENFQPENGYLNEKPTKENVVSFSLNTQARRDLYLIVDLQDRFPADVTVEILYN